MRVLSRVEYDAVLRIGLTGLGVPAAAIEKLLDLRWPMPPAAVVSELFGRGIVVTLEAVHDFLALDGVDSATAIFSPLLVDLCAEWLVETGRAEANEAERYADAESIDAQVRDRVARGFVIADRTSANSN